jgi:hypothetical protein
MFYPRTVTKKAFCSNSLQVKTYQSAFFSVRVKQGRILRTTMHEYRRADMPERANFSSVNLQTANPLS